jgi:hypothetical protein
MKPNNPTQLASESIIINGSRLNFNIRWWAWGLISVLFGIAIGYILWGGR